MKKSMGRIIAGAAVGAGLGYLASKGAFIDPAIPGHVAQQMAANLPSSGSASSMGAAIGGAAAAGYSVGKHHALNKTQFK